MKNRAIDHRNDWSTPKDFYDKLAEKYNFSGYDPCPIYGSVKYCNGLSGGLWPDSVFVNPPYERIAKENFIRMGIKSKSCFLLPVSTSTKLFHDVIKPNATHIEFIKGRLNFEGVNSKGQWVNPGVGRLPHPAADLELEQVKACGMHDSMLVFFGYWKH